MNSGKSNGDSGETSVTQPKTSTPKLSTKARSSASLGQSKQSKLNQSEQPNAEAASQSQSLCLSLKLTRHYLHHFHLLLNQYWLVTSGGRVPVVAVCVLHTQLRICCDTDLACL